MKIKKIYYAKQQTSTKILIPLETVLKDSHNGTKKNFWNRIIKWENKKKMKFLTINEKRKNLLWKIDKKSLP